MWPLRRLILVVPESEFFRVRRMRFANLPAIAFLVLLAFWIFTFVPLGADGSRFS